MSTSRLICFVGIDGSGKTLQAQKLAASLNEHGIPCAYTWCRYSPRLMMPLIWLAKKLIRREKGGSEYSSFISGKQGMLSKPLLGWIWLNVGLFEYLIQATVKVRRRLWGSRVLISDRYIYDAVADLAISFGRSGVGVTELARHPLFRWFPQPDKVYFLDVPAEVCWARKQDPNVMAKQYLVDREQIYSHLCDSLGFTRVDGDRPIEEIAADVLKQTLEHIEKTESEVTNCPV